VHEGVSIRLAQIISKQTMDILKLKAAYAAYLRATCYVPIDAWHKAIIEAGPELIELAEKALAADDHPAQIEISDRDIMEEWDRHFLGYFGEPFLKKVVHFARQWMKDGAVMEKRHGEAPSIPPAVRRFVRVGGFYDRTAYVEYTKGNAYSVNVDGFRSPCLTPLERAEEFVRSGSWCEIPVAVPENIGEKGAEEGNAT